MLNSAPHEPPPKAPPVLPHRLRVRYRVQEGGPPGSNQKRTLVSLLSRQCLVNDCSASRGEDEIGRRLASTNEQHGRLVLTETSEANLQPRLFECAIHGNALGET